MLLHSYHNHTCLCGHAEGTAEAYVRSASRKDLLSIGISDHMPLPDGRWSKTRMLSEQLDGYIREVEELKRTAEDIVVFLAGECEWDETYEVYYRELLEEHCFDYLIGAPHWIPVDDDTWLGYTRLRTVQHLRSFSEYVQATIESGLFLFIAHPDVYLSGYTLWDENARSCARDICRSAAAYDIPLELNANGLRKKPILDAPGTLRPPYPVREFWEIAAEEGTGIIVGADAHAPEAVDDLTDRCYSWVRELSLFDRQEELFEGLTVGRPVEHSALT